ncbi:MAG: hypothetical protein EOO56_27795 [Hymenobacter sp.]|nr:MAG: hypothetical protein EOO56_27795 [Hymenobacter sp.]
MNTGALTTTGSGRHYLSLLLVLLVGLLLGSCRTCPLDSCHVRKVHLHNGVKYRARPLWKMQNPAIGERIKINKQGKEKRRESDHSRSL